MVSACVRIILYVRFIPSHINSPQHPLLSNTFALFAIFFTSSNNETQSEEPWRGKTPAAKSST